MLRWVAAGMNEARKQFRRVNGHLHLPALRAALDLTVPAITPGRKMPPDHHGPPPNVHRARDILGPASQCRNAAYLLTGLRVVGKVGRYTGSGADRLWVLSATVERSIASRSAARSGRLK